MRVFANHVPPYRIIQGGEPTGLYVDIFQEIADRLGWKVHYREALKLIELEGIHEKLVLKYMDRVAE